MALASSEGLWDAAVIGAGPAGSMAARELAVAGARVLLVDRRAFPRDKVCGGCLNGQALAVLRAAGLGDLPRRAGGRALGSFRLGVAGRSVRLELPAGVVVSRARFDAELAAAAVEAGATFVSEVEAGVGAAIEGAFRHVRLGRAGDERTICARVVLLATGLGGRGLPDGLGPRTRVAAGSRVGVACLLDRGADRYEAGTIHMAVGKAGYVGLVVQDGGGLHVAAALDPAECRRRGGPGAAAAAILAEARLPALDELATADWRGTPGLTRRTR
ncbi:MAG: NAD(P)/FAD-dependent oxidoreductase, partial [Isosphaeraceae bacterium]